MSLSEFTADAAEIKAGLLRRQTGRYVLSIFFGMILGYGLATTGPGASAWLAWAALSQPAPAARVSDVELDAAALAAASRRTSAGRSAKALRKFALKTPTKVPSIDLAVLNANNDLQSALAELNAATAAPRS